MEIKEFEKILKEEAQGLEIILTKEQVNNFYNYMKILIEWNQNINLTAITEPKEIIIKHFIDSITINKFLKEEDKVIDLGTGAGFPGIPLKIINNTIDIALVDSLNKRINFLNETINKLKLEKATAIHSRAEDLGRNKNHKERYDVAVSRAVAYLNILLEYIMPFVKIGGRCICMKGANISEELDKSRNAIKILGGEIEKIDSFKLANTDIKRNIIIIKKIKNTPEKYPRKAGIPSKLPII